MAQVLSLHQTGLLIYCICDDQINNAGEIVGILPAAGQLPLGWLYMPPPPTPSLLWVLCLFIHLFLCPLWRETTPDALLWVLAYIPTFENSKLTICVIAGADMYIYLLSLKKIQPHIIMHQYCLVPTQHLFYELLVFTYVPMSSHIFFYLSLLPFVVQQLLLISLVKRLWHMFSSTQSRMLQTCLVTGA